MPVFVKVVGFSLTLTLAFTLIANLLPQVEGEAPEEMVLDLGTFTEESFVAMGENLFSGKGTCTLCHNSMGRAPDIQVMNMGETANERLADPRYKGKATDVETYLRESLWEPSLYVVKNFGKKGSNDTVSPMPVINKPPVGLSDIEMNALIAYMQAKDGNPVTVTLPTTAAELHPGDAEEKARNAPVQPEVAQSAEEALVRYSCTACHSVLEAISSMGPDLRTVGNRSSADEIRESILNPNALIAEGFDPLMPEDFAVKLRVKELEMLVAFLAKQKTSEPVSSESEVD
jgi:hypothetical protein